jgi:glycosyltransferase involved in cell wall biosynthesis
LLVGPGDTAALGEAVRRYFADETLRRRLRGAAASSVAGYAPERVFGELEQILRRIAGT